VYFSYKGGGRGLYPFPQEFIFQTLYTNHLQQSSEWPILKADLVVLVVIKQKFVTAAFKFK